MASTDKGWTNFSNWIQQHPTSFSIFAAQAPVEAVVEYLNKLFRVEWWQKDVVPAGKLLDLSGVPVIRLKDQNWTLVYWSLNRYINIDRDCERLCRRLDQRVFNIWNNDLKGLIEWSFWENAKDHPDIIDECKWAHDDTPYLKSLIRIIPHKDELTQGFWQDRLPNLLNDLLVDQTLYFPRPDQHLAEDLMERIDLLFVPTKPLGMREFRNYIYEGEYTLVVVKAPIDVVTKEAAAIFNTKEWKQDIKVDIPIWETTHEEDIFWMPVIQPLDNIWTVVLCCLGGHQNVIEICESLSTKLNTKVINLAEEVSSGTIQYRCFDQGRTLEYIEGFPGEEMHFTSEIREEPELDDFDEDEMNVISDFIDRIFIEEGVYIPPPDMRVTDPWLARVDLIPRTE